MRGPGDTVGPYRLEQKIGEGSYGVVFLAVAVRQGGVPIPVALKVARDRAVGAQAFLGEASTWVRAGGHPNVVPVIDAGVYDDEFLLVSEYIEGGTLRDRIVRENGKGQPVDEALRILDGILLGLEHLHGRGVIHRDLKPQNILMQGGIPRLSDFGVARLAGGATSQTTNRAGTLVYMPPEAFSGTVSRQTDLWAAGIMLFEMLTGRVSFLGATEFAIMGAI
ncbi:MAG: serine/threonine protein kinase, partial [Armatimonadetes bacterium]|nr:serine/threonine protein kinase [Armatimonadota bacterium]